MRREGFLDLADSSLEPSLGGSNLLIVRVPFAGPPSVPTFFWTEISGPENKKLAYIKFERRLFIRSESLFVATEWRPADSGDLRPEPFLRFSGYQKQGCAGSRTDTSTPIAGTGVLCTCGCKPTKRNAPLSMDAIRIKEYEAEAELLRLEAAAIDDLLVKERLLAQSSLASLRAKQIANLCNSFKRCDV
ncbi:hypothetical protein [Xylella fastidiosa]|uniref:hypothetical protein n=6 Tax=Xylella fastidiosa TaxID=2371 RepID=UPI00056DBC67|nr:hypothetical protein [Xylella fastidiosa]KAJ4853153.1 hypothetical protein XYFPCFBP8418_002520 [Xylella fastidiosa subsp. multiplex]MDC6410210.1 hypothetical protein [Xylella fastidiosa subsp. multiplex]MDC6415899.1 hypothetical protein [Xylella fastidiosa subsp. multiplex]MDC6416712.1 hypothetical protein [Xylella fastidiosa subsp. multiplex]MDC6418785.1 hypothetical protein [Xylella fastidiosa subsp. multiplex]